MSEYITRDAGTPWTVRRMSNGPTHIVARDGFTIIATVNRDRDGIAEMLAASPELLDMARRMHDGDHRSAISGAKVLPCKECDFFAKVEGR